MSHSLVEILDRLEGIARYDGPWRVLAKEGPLLAARLAELRERENRLDDLLVVALVGGSGVGKSTLLNALAGDELAAMSEFRPCTSIPTVYHPPGAQLTFPGDWHSVTGSALEHLVVVDTPDSDTIVKQHRAIVSEVLAECDLILMCADSEKYLDEATWSLLRPLQNERTMVCVETKANGPDAIREHWLERLKAEGFRVEHYFRTAGRRTLDRKLSGEAPGDDEYDFAALENFLYRELTRERILRIKRSNAAGLMVKTFATLDERVCSRGPELDAVESAIDAADQEMAREGFEAISERLFAEPHLWMYALGRETALRAKGVVGTLYRVLEAVRSLPARVASWPVLGGRRSAGQQAAAMLASADLVAADLDVDSPELRRLYDNRRSELGLKLAEAGIELPPADDGFQRYLDGLNERIGVVLRGPARERLVHRARLLTSWPVAVACDIPPLAFVGVSGYTIVATYFGGSILPVGFLPHAVSVLAIVLGVELFALTLTARGMAWSARRAAVADLRTGVATSRIAFSDARRLVEEARGHIAAIESLRAAVEGREL